ncbi:MAG: NHL repeat-containing protein [Verrucomicrobiota bacterium]
MSNVEAVAVDPVTGKVFVADQDGDRVLRYPDLASLRNGAGAEAVLGQSNFVDEGTSTTRQSVADASGLFVDHRGRLWVADKGNHRVLMFEMASVRSTFAFADRVYGQPNFTTAVPSATASTMNSPSSVWVDMGDHLWVADSGNNRVLRFDSINSKSSSAAANGVLGQVDFTTGTEGAGSSGLQLPAGIAVSAGGELFVSCFNGNRILRFNNAATLGNGAGANAVLGQADFISIAIGTSATTLNGPGGLEITASDQLWVADRVNQRVIRYDAASTASNGKAASGVVGQPNFTTSTIVTASARSLDLRNYILCGLTVDAKGALWVPDSFNQRVLRFPEDVTSPVLSVINPPKVVTKKKLKITGSAGDTYGVTRVQYKVGDGPLKTASGTTSWNFTIKLAKGEKAKIAIYATDSVGNTSAARTVKVRRSK